MSKYKDDWVELLGCGIIEHKILENCECPNKFGWAFGFGLERLAMLVFGLQDIRLLWTKDQGYITSQQNIIKNLFDSMPEGQFQMDKVKNLKFPTNLNKAPPKYINISFFMKSKVEPNDIYDICRDYGGEMIESVTMKSSFFHPKKKLESNTYELIFRSHQGVALETSEVEKVAVQIKKQIEENFDIEPRWK